MSARLQISACLGKRELCVPCPESAANVTAHNIILLARARPTKVRS